MRERCFRVPNLPKRDIPGRGAISVGALCCTLFLPCLAGCPDLSQVQQFAKTSDGAESAVTLIAADFKGSCDRQNLYVLPPPPPAKPPPQPCVNGDDLGKLGNNLIAEQNILFEYIDTLGTLAGTDASGFEAEAPSLGTSFGNAGLSATQQDMANAVGTLAAQITKMATAAYREKKILEILKDADPAVQTLTKGLADQVAPPPAPAAATGTSYLELLGNEETLLKSYYEIPLAKDPDSLTAILVRNQDVAALDQLKAREEAAKAYRTLMIAIGQAHAKLLADSEKKGFNKDAVKKISKDLAQPVAEITGAITSLQKDLR